MRLFSSLFAKILLWSLLNLVLVASVLAVFFTFQSHMDLDTLLGRQASDRIRIAGNLIAHDLNKSPEADWSEILIRHGDIYQIQFAMVFKNGSETVPTDLSVPPVVIQKIMSSRKSKPSLEGLSPRLRHNKSYSEAQSDHRFHDTSDRERDHNQESKEIRRSHPKHDSEARFMMRTTNPTRYWTGVWIAVLPEAASPPRLAMLLAVSDSPTGNGFFFDPLPWMIVALVIVLISVVLWIPFVRHITGPLARMTSVAEEIARGRFDVQIKEHRKDEIGRLATAINDMTLRLHSFLKGQKRFLGDVAHELASPIARIQLGLGILEQRVDKKNRERVVDVMEDVTHMADLINELLSFSRAEMHKKKVHPELTKLLPIVQKAVQREQTPDVEISYRIDPEMTAIADPELLTRALANLIRNSVRYAGDAGPITLSAKNERNSVILEIRDAGPGVPEDVINQLFEPFFRPEASRNRDSGGVGLGLAIVKTCVEACQGTVAAKNCAPAGFSVTITLSATNSLCQHPKRQVFRSVNPGR